VIGAGVNFESRGEVVVVGGSSGSVDATRHSWQGGGGDRIGFLIVDLSLVFSVIAAGVKKVIVG
jgi:hypothetical protein